VFRHFPTKEQLIEVALLRHFDQLVEQAQALDDWRTLVRTMIETGATKLALASQLNGIPESVVAASDRLKAAVREVLRRAQESGAVRPSITVEEVYLLIRGLAQASVTMPVEPDVLERAIDVVLSGTEDAADISGTSTTTGS
jgi:AcrR family transcriptional regulator